MDDIDKLDLCQVTAPKAQQLTLEKWPEPKRKPDRLPIPPFFRGSVNRGAKAPEMRESSNFRSHWPGFLPGQHDEFTLDSVDWDFLIATSILRHLEICPKILSRSLVTTENDAINITAWWATKMMPVTTRASFLTANLKAVFGREWIAAKRRFFVRIVILKNASQSC